MFILVFPRSLLGSRRVKNIPHELGMKWRHTLDDSSSSNPGDSHIQTVGTARPGCHGREPRVSASMLIWFCYRWTPPEDTTVVETVGMSSTHRGRAEGRFSDRLHGDETVDKPLSQIGKGGRLSCKFWTIKNLRCLHSHSFGAGLWDCNQSR